MDFFEWSRQDLQGWLEKEGYKSYAAGQILDWIYRKKEFDFFRMTNLSLELRKKLSKTFELDFISLLHIEESKTSEVTKFLWKLKDEALVESVLIRSSDRRTVCVSSQVGCNARCAFCASGKEGFFRNLTSSEILMQIVLIDRHLNRIGESVSHVVFMGMGEPLENYDAVLSAVRKITHPQMLQISQRRITISTVGVVDRILRLAHEDLKINLVLSLHAPNQHIRKKIIPYARKYELQEVLNAMDHYALKTKRDVTYEYILIDEINSEAIHAKELASLLKGKQCTVNLIPYNPVEGVKLSRPAKEKIEVFKTVLESEKIPVTWRYTKGKDIAAACGQLALKKKREVSLPIFT